MADADAAIANRSVHSGRENNRLRAEDFCVHDWYRFILSYPPHLVRDYLDRFGIRKGATVLDPFCGTGTTLVECKKLGISSIGIEANPMPWFASRVKADMEIRRSETVNRRLQLHCSGCGNSDRFVEEMRHESHLVDGNLIYLHLLDAEAGRYVCFQCGREVEVEEVGNAG